MEWVASSLQLDSEQSIQCYYNRSPPTRTPRKPVVDSTDTPAHINGLVRFAGRPNLVSALVPSYSVFNLTNYSVPVIFEPICTFCACPNVVQRDNFTTAQTLSNRAADVRVVSGWKQVKSVLYGI